MAVKVYTVYFYGGPRDGDWVKQPNLPGEEYFIDVNRDLNKIFSTPVNKQDTPQNSQEFHFYLRSNVSGNEVFYEYQGVSRAGE